MKTVNRAPAGNSLPLGSLALLSYEIWSHDTMKLEVLTVTTAYVSLHPIAMPD